jgi:diguanylate cyclase (GGDEF)-like protein
MADRAIEDNKAISKVDYDVLTGLPNRLSMERALKIAVDHAAQALKRRSKGAALFIEIMDFEELVEQHGRLTANEILVSSGKLLKDILRVGDNGYRLGSNQFGVIFKGISMAEAHLAAERILKGLNGVIFQVGTENHRLNLSLALLQIDGKKEAAELFSSALVALEKTRSLGQNQITVL